jgi:ABC-type multidrug transport system fused ATPase/permease subunit
MTVSERAFPKNLREKLQGRAKPVDAPEKPNDTSAVAKRLISYMVDADRRRFIIALAVRLVGDISLILVPVFTGLALNILQKGTATTEELMLLVGAAMVAGVIYLVTAWFAERQFADLATMGLERLHRALFDHMQSLSLSFFDRQPLGQLMSRITNDTEFVALFYEQAVSQLMRSVFRIAIIVVVMFLIDWRLALVGVIIIPVMLVLTGIVQRISTPAFRKMGEEMGDLSGFQEETISGHKVVISSRRQDWAAETQDDQAGNVYETASHAFFTSVLQFPLTQTLTILQVTVVLMVGSLMVFGGELELGTVITFMGFVYLLASPLSDIANLMATSLNAIAGGRRVFGIMDEQPTVEDAPDAAEYEFKGGRIEFRDVDFSYVEGRKILRHNTFDAAPGEKIGICGPTGAGKSTIINILTRYYDIDSGTILIDGQDISKLTQQSLRRQVGVVLQEAFLFSETVMDNLRYAREGATDEECIEAAQQANAHEFIENLPQGYDTLLTERGANLSQGQRQMITIARAMVAQPKIMVLDEATSNVDTRTEKLIQDGLTKLMTGKTSFSIAHRLATIRDSSRIMVVNGGVIVEMDAHETLMAEEGFYYNLYMSQFKGKGPGGEVDTSGFIST